jgi:hypothetical protein
MVGVKIMSLAELIPPTPTNGVGAGSTIFIPFIVHFWGYLPSTVAVLGGMLGIIWYCLMIWESETCKDWRTKWLTKRKMRKIGRLQARVKLYQAELEALDVKREAEQVATGKIEAAKVEAAKVTSATEQAVSQVK